MNKKGQSLPLNTLIIIILVVIVLIVVAVFFLGGTSSLSKSIRNIFYGTTAGTDLTLAREICTQRCEPVQGLDVGKAKLTVYCTSGFNIDKDNDGSVDDGEAGIKCTEDPINHICQIRTSSTGATSRLVC